MPRNVTDSDLEQAFAYAITETRKDGRVGTRNYVAVIATVNCSSTATTRVVDHFRRHPELLAGLTSEPHETQDE